MRGKRLCGTTQKHGCVHNSGIKLIGLLLFMAVYSIAMAQEKPRFIKLIVMYDNEERPAPNQLTFSFGNLSTRVAVRDGVFEVPIDFIDIEKYTLTFDIDADHVHMRDIPRTSFDTGFWKILFASNRYSAEHQWAIPKGVSISKSCILVANPWGKIFHNCRSKRK